MEPSAAYTKAALFAFLKKAETTGLYKANTVGGLRAAAMRLLEDVGDADDVRSVDVDEAALRYHNRHPSELSSASLAEYQRRLRRLLDEFSAFNENPAGYRPKGRITRAAAGKTNGESDQKGQVRAGRASKVGSEVSEADSDDIQSSATASVSRVPMLRLSYPIRDDVLAEIAVPRGMTTEEAKRLCAFVMTLAKDFAPA
jgi:hypothetical protein